MTKESFIFNFFKSLFVYQNNNILLSQQILQIDKKSWIVLFLLYQPSPANKVLGVYRNHLDRTYVFLCNRFQSISFLSMNIWIPTQFVYDLEMCPDFGPKSIRACSRSIEGKVHNSCPVYIFFIEKHWKILFNTKIANVS